jgi:acetyl-CoA acetyltransferase
MATSKHSPAGDGLGKSGTVQGHPYHDVVIAAVFNTRQAKTLEGYDSLGIAIEAALGAIERSGVRPNQVDGIFGQFAAELPYLLGTGPAHVGSMGLGGIPAILDAAGAIAAGHCSVALLAGGGAGIYTESASVAPWTRISNEFVIPFGMYTALEFALIARRHMHVFGTTPDQLAEVAATIRNNGHVNPEAVYRGRGPFTRADILESRMVADPFHLLDCAMTAEGGTAIVLAHADLAADLPLAPVYVLGGGVDHTGPSYQHPPSFDVKGSADDAIPNGWVGKRAAAQSFRMAGLSPADVDVAELYDPFSFEIIRQLEAFGFCEPGDGGDFVSEGHIAAGGSLPVTTDGGLLSFSHGGGTVQMLQRVVRAVEQLQGTCVTNQVPGAEVALASNGGAGAFFNEVLLLGTTRP